MNIINILILLIILLILVCILIATVSINHKITGGKKKKFNNSEFLFPEFGTHSKNRLLNIDPKNFLRDRKLEIDNLHRTDIRSIILQTYNYSDKIGIINYILERLIYPIDFNLSSKELELYIIDDRKANLITTYNLPKRHISNWQLPLGLYLHKILEESECNILSKCIINFFKKIAPHKLKLKYFTSMDLQKERHYTIKKMLIFTKKDKNVYQYIKKIIHKFFKIFYGDNYDSYYDINILYETFPAIIGYFSSNINELSSGLKLHTDKIGQAAISIISLENSILDFVPWGEFFHKLPSFRVIIPKGYMVTFDGDIRHFYTHGVPSGIEYPNNFRLAINFRHPLLHPEKNTNCTKQFDIPEFSNIKCISSSFDNPLKFEY